MFNLLKLTFGLVLGFGCVGFIAYVLTFRPQWILRLQATNQRKWYKDSMKMSDEEIDRLPLFFLDRNYVEGSRSNFINNAIDHPEEFEWAMTSLRVLGAAFWGLFIVSLLFVIWGLVSGSPFDIS